MKFMEIQKIRKSFGSGLLQLVFVTSSVSVDGQTDEGSNTNIGSKTDNSAAILMVEQDEKGI